MAYFAEFITARFQREIPMEVAVGVASTSYFRVGQMVKVVDGVVKTLSASTVSAAKEEATHIIAQSDMTMEYGHVPVEYRDYRYSDQVKGTVSDATNLLGAYESKADFPAAATGNNNKYAFAIDEQKVYKSNGTTWAVDTGITVTSKKVALFKILNADDLKIRVNN